MTEERAPFDWVTIVSGLPRSGTSMMMQLLEAGGIPALTDRIREADEDNPRGYYEFEPVKRVREDASWLPEGQGRVVKMVYRLLYDLPSGYAYRVVFMLRDLNEVIASQDVMLQRLGKADDTVDEARLREMYRRQLDEMEIWLREQPNFSVLYVQYRDVVRDPDKVIQDLNSFLGGSLETGAMRRVPDASLYRQRART